MNSNFLSNVKEYITISNKLSKFKGIKIPSQLEEILIKHVEYKEFKRYDDIIYMKLIKKHKDLYDYFPSIIIYQSNIRRLEIFTNKNRKIKLTHKYNYDDITFDIPVPSRNLTFGPALRAFHSNTEVKSEWFVENNITFVINEYDVAGNIKTSTDISGVRKLFQDNEPWYSYRIEDEIGLVEKSE